MVKNIIIAVQSLFVIGLGAYVVTSNRGGQPEPLPAAQSGIAKENAEAPSSVESKQVQDTKQLSKAHNLIAALYEENQALEKETEPSLEKGIKQLVESPGMQNVIRKDASRKVKHNYAGLFKKLGFGPEQEAALMAMLVDQKVESAGTDIQWMAGNIEEAAKQMVAAREKIHQQILEQFGQEALDEYRYWEATEDERKAVTKMNRDLGENRLDGEASDMLVGMMYDTLGEFKELDYLGQPENFDPRDFNPEYRENIMGQVDQLHGRYLEQAAATLSPLQLATYEATLSQQRKDLEQFLRYTFNLMSKENP
ncbi:MAG: hypothetical protein K9M45_12800 [Kiritimatiellales bacterium]|nr:hypothetical protein [Kiritimatiellales bacterium]